MKNKSFTNTINIHDELQNLPTNEITVDDSLSDSSTNPVQNKVINTAISNLETSINNISDTNTTYSLGGSGSTITLTGSDGSTSSRTISGGGITDYSLLQLPVSFPFYTVRNKKCIVKYFYSATSGIVVCTFFCDFSTIATPADGSYTTLPVGYSVGAKQDAKQYVYHSLYYNTAQTHKFQISYSESSQSNANSDSASKVTGPYYIWAFN